MLGLMKILTNPSVVVNLLILVVSWYENRSRSFTVSYSLVFRLDILVEMFTSVTPSKDTFLSQARNARELRHNAKFENECAVRIQKTVRGWLCRQKLARHIRSYFYEYVFKIWIVTVSVLSCWLVLDLTLMPYLLVPIKSWPCRRSTQLKESRLHLTYQKIKKDLKYTAGIGNSTQKIFPL